MANLRSIKNRIKSVKSTGKITQAMKMVAASKVKKAEMAAKEARPYEKFLLKIFAQLANTGKDFNFENAKYSHAIENYPALLVKREVKTVGLLVLTSDKGLAGSYNANVVKETIKLIEKYKAENKNIKLFVVGLKGISALKHITSQDSSLEMVKNYSKIPVEVEIEVAKMIAEDMAEAFVSGGIDAIEVVYTEFKTMLSYLVKNFQLLPFQTPQTDEKISVGEMLFEPSKEAVLQKLVPLYLANTIYSALKEATASEQAARMNAMSNATKNAEEMVKILSNTYNKARQYGITQDIIEVVSGANAT